MDTITAKGMNGTVEFDGRVLTIKREGFVARASQGNAEKVIPLRSIGSVTFVPKTLLQRAHWAVSPLGETDKMTARVGQRRDLMSGNSVIVKDSQVESFKALNAAIIEAQGMMG